MTTSDKSGTQQDQRRAPGKTPREQESEVKSTPEAELRRIEATDNAADPQVRPVLPQCRKCGATFSLDSEMVEHAKTCKGGHERAVHPHSHH